MIEGFSPIAQTAIGTSLTWGATALGAVFCAFQPTTEKRIRNVMLAASFWSLLQPAIDLAKTVDRVKSADSMGSVCYLPAAVGLLAGAAFIILVDYFFPEQALINTTEPSSPVYSPIVDDRLFGGLTSGSVRYRGNDFISPITFYKPRRSTHSPRVSSRIWLFIVAITLHNIPEGLAVGVAFGARDDSTAGGAFLRARNLALGMAIQNVPEGLAVSLPMRAAGYSFWQSFWYGQLSGIVEPLAGILGCITVQYVNPLQPYALGFAAGAMIFVIFDDVIPEAHRK
ncbi:unnamed protein product [Hydatigera taeniaeformis]|uniref:Zinc transporter ZIP11 n=1 Tax=Hydatigena taeniaeformis TaxID=6205 RepID=A0A0R3WK63_HYDTA|nr:unnamed protein product [Hydatigera taeniaeformis]